MNRRGFLLGLGASLVAAPAIVRAASLMAVKSVEGDEFLLYGRAAGGGKSSLTLQAMLRAKNMLRNCGNDGPLYLFVPSRLLTDAKKEFPGVIVRQLASVFDGAPDLPPTLIVRGPAYRADSFAWSRKSIVSAPGGFGFVEDSSLDLRAA